jgi:hypothetical protein
MKKTLKYAIILWILLLLYCLVTLPFLVRFGGEKTVAERFTVFLMTFPIDSIPNGSTFFVNLILNTAFWATIFLFLSSGISIIKRKL